VLKRLFGLESAGTARVVVDVATARTLQKTGAQLIDVREPFEFTSGHAPGARNIPLGQLARRIGEIAPNHPVLLICASGNRSRVAQDLLARHGIADARNVTGGMHAWQRAGLPVM
jgi:rhodanese-related sulfurtransferase